MNLQSIIELIDNKAKAELTPVQIQPIAAFGLAERYYEDDIFYPAVYNSLLGEYTNVLLDDRYRCSWYHRTQTGVYAVVPNSFGDKLDRVEETVPVDLVIYNNNTQFSAQTIKDMFVKAIPSVLSKQECESLNIDNCLIELESHELDTMIILRRETNAPDVRAGAKHGLLSIRYTIKTTYRRGCDVICGICE